MTHINLEDQLRDFQSQQYPTDEQTVVNNASVLYKRKKFFLEDLRLSVKFLGFIFIGLIYLRDLSFLRLVLRAFTQYSISNPYPAPHMRVSISEESKRALTKFLLVGVIAGNIFCFATHLIFGSYRVSPYPDGFLHGGMTIQFIGERLPYTKLELLVFDVSVFFVQIIFHSLMCVTDDSEVLASNNTQTTPDYEEYALVRPEIEGDGYSGNVHLMTIDFIGNIRKVMSFHERFLIQRSMTAPQEQEQSPVIPMPGSFV